MRVLLSPSCRYHLSSSQEIESHLPEEDINGIGEQPRKPGLRSIVMKVGETKVLFHSISFLRYLFFSFYFIVCQFCCSRIFSHDTVSDLVQIKKIPVWFSQIPLIGIPLLNGFFGMTTAGDTERQIRTVMIGGRGHLGGKNEPVQGIDRGMFFKTEVRDIVFYRPVGIEVPAIFKGFPIFITFSLGSFSFLFFFLQFLFTDGMTGRFNQAGVNGDTLFMVNFLKANWGRRS